MIAIIPHGANNVNITLLWVCRTGSLVIPFDRLDRKAKQKTQEIDGRVAKSGLSLADEAEMWIFIIISALICSGSNGLFTIIFDSIYNSSLLVILSLSQEIFYGVIIIAISVIVSLKISDGIIFFLLLIEKHRMKIKGRIWSDTTGKRLRKCREYIAIKYCLTVMQIFWIFYPTYIVYILRIKWCCTIHS